uniref:Ribonuclease H-like domain-containing protein n=1 Tax=Tanacetum cinerariifolium TaxID=118510 RepID=A0A6L2K5I5_TANCI|nr:ribonuclease H-like domain-containing protein [Tanacetum cinerariifolium]
MFLSLMKYDVEIRERAHMVNCNPSQTPVDTEFSMIDLGSHGDDGDLRQPMLSCSSAEAEYRGVANVVVDLLVEESTTFELFMFLHVISMRIFSLKAYLLLCLRSFIYQFEYTMSFPSNCEGVLVAKHFIHLQDLRFDKCAFYIARLDQLVITIASGDIGQGFDPHSLQGQISFSAFGRTETSLSTLGRGKAVYISTSPIHCGRRY